MSKRELKALKSLLSGLLPYIQGKKQATALFTVMLLLALSHGAFDAPHVHVESAPVEEPIASVMVSNAASGTMTYHWTPYNPWR
jgi:hypothetical protein